jgi:hypothetical protein
MTISVNQEVEKIEDYIVERKKGCKGIFSTKRTDIHKLMQADALITALINYGVTNDHFIFLNILSKIISTEIKFEKEGLMHRVLLRELLRLELLAFDELIQANDIEGLRKAYKMIEARRVDTRMDLTGDAGVSKAYIDETTKNLRAKLQDVTKPEQCRLLAELIRDTMPAPYREDHIQSLCAKIKKNDEQLATELKDIFDGKVIALSVMQPK